MKRPSMRTFYGALFSFFACQLAPHAAGASTTPAECTDEAVDLILQARHASAQSCMVPFGGALYFAAYEEATGIELWRSDRTEAGTAMLTDLYAGPIGSVPTELTEFAGRLWFQAGDDEHGAELWSSDGTAAGTRLETDIAPGPASSWPASLTDSGTGLLYFSASRALDGRELWAYGIDDSQAYQIADIWIGRQGSSPSQFAMLNGHLYFRASDSNFGSELWVSDGTSATIFEDLAPGASSSSPYNLEVYDGSLHFETFTRAEGIQSYVTQGIRGSTQLAVGTTNRTVLSWQAPTANEDGSALLDLAGYIIYYWSDTEPRMKWFGVSAHERNSHAFNNLAPGNYHFMVTALSAGGGESLPTHMISKRIL